MLAVPILMLPSVLSLAYPDENPALNRAGGVMVAAYLIAALALEAVLRRLYQKASERSRSWVVGIVAAGLLLISASQNFYLVFNQFQTQYSQSAWNTSEIGAVIRQFSDTIGDDSQAWVIPYPHWVDTRLVGIHAVGYVKDFALWNTDIEATTDAPTPRLYIYKPEDEETYQILQELFPGGVVQQIDSAVDGRDFMLYYVLDKGQTTD